MTDRPTGAGTSPVADPSPDAGAAPGAETPPAPLVGYTEGAFDLFHVGHLDLLTAAAHRCDHLVVGVLSDELCEAATGARPYTPAAERRAVVEAVRGVDAVVPVTEGDLPAMHASTGFSVVFRHGGPVAPDACDTSPAAETAHGGHAVRGYEVVDLPAPRRTTSAVLAAALAGHLAPAAEL